MAGFCAKPIVMPQEIACAYVARSLLSSIGTIGRSGVAHTDKEARENSDQENADNKDPNCENGTSEDEPLLEGHRLNDMSVDGDSSIDDLKPKREKDVWTDKPFRDIHNSLCVQKKGEETETGVHGQNTEGSSDETDVKRLDMQKGVNEQSTEEPSDETDVKRLDMQQGVNEQNTEKSSVETVVECSVKLSVEATS
ncbi:hypothetical protein MAR_020404 [Mya arenaria]|uniref:Uncharacterized protein n=1 Tax=Mya arenaria TaxID=6604 RepID=A0ABY7E7T5_MYAAR|nr:hypothetical protein MAR_020404 [Mya arenaria]